MVVFLLYAPHTSVPRILRSNASFLLTEGGKKGQRWRNGGPSPSPYPQHARQGHGEYSCFCMEARALQNFLYHL
jgi:hypothetical protein